jgi:hypothetical protein
MFALRDALRDLLATDAQFGLRLNFVPNTSPARTRRAVYINHISHFPKVLFPAAFLSMDGGTDDDVRCADDITVNLDIWTHELQPDPLGPDAGMAYGATDADRLYRRARVLLHQLHLRTALRPALFACVSCHELYGSRTESYDATQKLFTVTTRYRVRLIENGAEVAVAN